MYIYIYILCIYREKIPQAFPIAFVVIQFLNGNSSIMSSSFAYFI